MQTFSKYQGLGNSYLVLKAQDGTLRPKQIQSLCSSQLGIGSDGILWVDDRKGFRVKIYNPDGSEAEKSGNGLRIVARYLWDQKKVKAKTSFVVKTLGGPVVCSVWDKGSLVRAEMGAVKVLKQNHPLKVKARTEKVSLVSVGNPHCVLQRKEITPEEAMTLGTLIENHREFPKRTNVQFVKVVDRKKIQVEIWERGAGYTLSSGSSACAAVAAMLSLGLCDNEVQVCMQGGALNVSIDAHSKATIEGPVDFIAKGTFRRP